MKTNRHKGGRSTIRVAIVAMMLLWLGCVCVLPQGVILFNTRVVGQVDARVTFLDGTPVGVGFTAQLYAGPEGTPTNLLKPLVPTTTFRTTPSIFAGYVNTPAQDVEVPGVRPGQKATVIMRAFDGSSWETSACRGESDPFVIPLGGVLGGFLPPAATLAGLQPFSVNCVPEPSTIALVVLGGAAFLLHRRLRRKPCAPGVENESGNHATQPK